MSHIKIKTKYVEEGEYWSAIERTLFVHHNLVSDYVTVYDENGKVIFTFNDTMRNNLLEAIKRTAGPVKQGELPAGVEYMDDQDCERIGI